MTIRGRALGPLVAAAIGLAGALAATLSLSSAATDAVDRVLIERLTGAGEAAAALLAAELSGAGGAAGDAGGARSDRLLAVMRANGLDGAYVLDRRLRVSADASGPSGRRADLLRLDLARVQRAQAGVATVAPGYVMGALTVMTGYFPIGGPDGAVAGTLVLEAGQTFVSARARIARARALGVALSLLSALGLALVAARWIRAEQERRAASARAAREGALSRVAAMAAHEIRNPLGVIRGTVDLMRERAGPSLTERDRQGLDDIADEVERLRRLTQDLVDLSADRPIATTPTQVGDLLCDAARATEAAFPQVTVRCQMGQLPRVEADPSRLRQVFVNLLANAAQAQPQGEIQVRATGDRRGVSVIVQDHGPGIPDEIGDRVFDLYFTTKSGGTGLGLAIARRFVERHGGTLVHLRTPEPGAAFEVVLPLQPPRARTAAEIDQEIAKDG